MLYPSVIPGRFVSEVRGQTEDDTRDPKRFERLEGDGSETKRGVRGLCWTVSFSLSSADDPPLSDRGGRVCEPAVPCPEGFKNHPGGN